MRRSIIGLLLLAAFQITVTKSFADDDLPKCTIDDLTESADTLCGFRLGEKFDNHGLKFLTRGARHVAGSGADLLFLDVVNGSVVFMVRGAAPTWNSKEDGERYHDLYMGKIAKICREMGYEPSIRKKYLTNKIGVLHELKCGDCDNTRCFINGDRDGCGNNGSYCTMFSIDDLGATRIILNPYTR